VSDSKSHEPYASWLSRIRQRGEVPNAVSNGRTHDEVGELSAGERPGGENPALVRFIAALDEPHTMVAEQYRLLAARLEGLWKQPGFQRVAITSTMQGEGKSLTTINARSWERL
jgi:Mrp family chromosome partitioning ATPase